MLVNQETCPFYKYGQCTIVPPELAYTVVNTLRCRKYWKTCRYYRKKLGLSSKKRTEENEIQKNVPLTSFLGRPEREIVVTAEVRKMNSRGKRTLEKKMSKVFQMLLAEMKKEEDSQA